MQKHRNVKIEASTMLLTIGLSILIFMPILGVASWQAGDFLRHIAFALTMKETGDVLHVSNILFHAITILYSKLLFWIPPQSMGLLTVLTAVMLLCGVVFKLLWNESADILHPLFIVLLTLSLLLIAPVVIWTDDIHWLGYINPVIYHSPTQNVLRVFVIPVALFANRVLENKPYHTINQRIFMTILSATLVILASLSKPSYTITIIPALSLYVIYHLWNRKSIDWYLFIFGICLPGVLIVALQYLVTYISTPADGSGLGFGFLQVMTIYVPLWRIPIQLVLSLLFPLGIYAMYFPIARQDIFLNLSWIALLIGLGYTYFVHETGYRIIDGNFVWTSYSAIFVLMFATLIFLLQRYRQFKQLNPTSLHPTVQQSRWRLRIASLLFVMHIVSGLIVYITFIDRFQNLT